MANMNQSGNQVTNNGSIHRVFKNNFGIIDLTAMQDKTLSLKAKGLHTYLMTLPADWHLVKSNVHKHHSEGKDATNSAFKELERSGYISKKPRRQENGSFNGWEYFCYQNPLENQEWCLKQGSEGSECDDVAVEPVSTKQTTKNNNNYGGWNLDDIKDDPIDFSEAEDNLLDEDDEDLFSEFDDDNFVQEEEDDNLVKSNPENNGLAENPATENPCDGKPVIRETRQTILNINRHNSNSSKEEYIINNISSISELEKQSVNGDNKNKTNQPNSNIPIDKTVDNRTASNSSNKSPIAETVDHTSCSSKPINKFQQFLLDLEDFKKRWNVIAKKRKLSPIRSMKTDKRKAGWHKAFELYPYEDKELWDNFFKYLDTSGATELAKKDMNGYKFFNADYFIRNGNYQRIEELANGDICVEDQTRGKAGMGTYRGKDNEHNRAMLERIKKNSISTEDFE